MILITHLFVSSSGGGGEKEKMGGRKVRSINIEMGRGPD